MIDVHCTAMDRLRFDGQVAVVTGAGKGLGRAYAEALAARGASVLVNNRRHEGEHEGSAGAVAAGIRARGGRAVANHEPADEPGSGQRIVEAAMEAFGRLDVVIPNAGIAAVAAFHKMTLARIDEVFAVNVRGALELVHAALPLLREQRSGRILMTTSSAALYGDAGFGAYAAAKSAMIGFVASLALETARAGIGVNAILPFAHTPMTTGLLESDAFPEGSASVLEPAAVASLATWLVSAECHRTGEVWLAGGRAFRRAAVVVSPGVVLDGEITAERIAASADEIARLDGAGTSASGQALLDDLARRSLGLTDD
jgi:NAD(P)-dependent dehydrogenase (short-subunit alcohol dehydrogenase family)